jgi:hypothetical protein
MRWTIARELFWWQNRKTQKILCEKYARHCFIFRQTFPIYFPSRSSRKNDKVSECVTQCWGWINIVNYSFKSPGKIPLVSHTHETKAHFRLGGKASRMSLFTFGEISLVLFNVQHCENKTAKGNEHKNIIALHEWIENEQKVSENDIEMLINTIYCVTSKRLWHLEWEAKRSKVQTRSLTWAILTGKLAVETEFSRQYS